MRSKALDWADEEKAAIDEKRAAYLEKETNHPTRWTAASGDTFTNLYKIESKAYRDTTDFEIGA